jgi:acetyl-CoA carboxylase biotin carboxyl carrier protein
VDLDVNTLRELLTAFNQTNISELTLKSGDFELTLRKDWPLGDRAGAGESMVAGFPQTTPPEANAAGTAAPPAAAPASSESAPEGGKPPSAPQPKLVDVTSPMVGTFYRAPAPGEAPFVEMNDRVGVGQTVCIIEAMKLMNEIEAEVAGQVVEVLVEDGEPVEYGQVLMRIQPNSEGV